MKPLWSVTIPSFNSAEFLEETLTSVLNQNISEDVLEIIVVDNCSTDDTAEIVSRVGKGRIKFISNEFNLGAIENFNKCVELANGELIHLLNSDDLVKEGFYKEFENKFAEYPFIGLVSCDSELINEKSDYIGESSEVKSLINSSNTIDEFFYSNPFRTPGVVVRKSAYKRLGNFDTNLNHCADWEMWVRVIKNCGGIHIRKYLCKYRYHSNNDTSKSFLVGRDILDAELVYKKFETLGYGISKNKYNRLLRQAIVKRYNYLYFLNKKKNNSLDSVRQISIRYNGLIKTITFIVLLKMEYGIKNKIINMAKNLVIK